MTVLTPTAVQQFFDDNGEPLVGGKLFTYAAGTTTKTNTFTDENGGTANTNPIILDARGEANVWLSLGVAYKFVLSPATDTDPPTNPIWTVDEISSPQPIPITPTAPTNPVTGSLWVNTGVTPIAVLQWDGAQWVPVWFLDTTNHRTANFATAPVTGCTVAFDAVEFTRLSFAAGYIGPYEMPAMNKSSSAWAAGNTNGARFPSSVTPPLWVYCFAMYNPTTYAFDWGWDDNYQGTNAPAGWQLSRIGTMFMIGNTPFTIGFANKLQVGALNLHKTAYRDLTLTHGSQVATSANVQVTVPPQVRVEAFGKFSIGSAVSNTAAGVLIQPIGYGQVSQPAGATAEYNWQPASGSDNTGAGLWRALTEEAGLGGQIRYSFASGSGTSIAFTLWTDGYYDTLGR